MIGIPASSRSRNQLFDPKVNRKVCPSLQANLACVQVPEKGPNFEAPESVRAKCFGPGKHKYRAQQENGQEEFSSKSTN